MVTYNAENRPIRWEQGEKVITMTFDRLGRRVACEETVAGETVAQDRFVYDGYLCVQRLTGALGLLWQEYLWDPTEPLATRPLVFSMPAFALEAYYFHDGNKNVTDLLSDDAAHHAHYAYAPFGALTEASDSGPFPLASANPFRFSSEVADDPLALVYYNYRHYSPSNARWTGRDFLEDWSVKLYLFCQNNPTFKDVIGLLTLKEAVLKELKEEKITPPLRAFLLHNDATQSLYYYYLSQWGEQKVFDIWIKFEERETKWRETLPECPKCINIKTLESPGEGWAKPQPRSLMVNPERYHPDAAYELRTSVANEVGAGNQCIYDKKGCLIESGVSTGTTDRNQAPSTALGGLLDLFSESGHVTNDVEPFDLAYRLDGNTHGANVKKYLRVRPAK